MTSGRAAAKPPILSKPSAGCSLLAFCLQALFRVLYALPWSCIVVIDLCLKRELSSVAWWFDGERQQALRRSKLHRAAFLNARLCIWRPPGGCATAAAGSA